MTSPKNRNLQNLRDALREMISFLLDVVLALVSSLHSLDVVHLLIRSTAIHILRLLFLP